MRYGQINPSVRDPKKGERYKASQDYKMLKASNRNDDPVGIRWINIDLIGFTYKIKNIKEPEETDTTEDNVVSVSSFIFFIPRPSPSS